MKEEKIAEIMASIEYQVRHAYNCGMQEQKDAMTDSIGDAYERGYITGVEDAWRFARGIVNMSPEDRNSCFQKVGAAVVIEKYTHDEALQKWREWKEQQSENEDEEMGKRITEDLKALCARRKVSLIMVADAMQRMFDNGDG